MPRSRRRHHSRSRSRSRSHSHDKDRDVKRRKIESFDSPHHRRSMSSEPEVSETNKTTDQNIEQIDEQTNDEKKLSSDVFKHPADSVDIDKEESDDSESDEDCKIDLDSSTTSDLNSSIQSLKAADANLSAKALSPKQLQKRMESDKRRMEQQKLREEREKKKQEERDERERKRQEERDEKKKVKEKLKQEKEDLKKIELEQKMQSKKEKEEKEEQKRKEKEQEKLKKQQEIDEKNREKQKMEEKKQKAAAAFAKFFVPKKETRAEIAEEKNCKFMPFEVKSDMRLAPIIRKSLTDEDKEDFLKSLDLQNAEQLYFYELKKGKVVGKSSKTWHYDEPLDDVILLDDLGESIIEPKLDRMKAKFLKFHENKRPAYFGTWRKKSKFISPKNPLSMDKELLNYEIDSEEEWEDEVDGESIAGSDDEDKDNESENDNDYEVDNEFFVEHAYLSDGEGCDDEDEEKVSPDAMKAKLHLMRKQFDEEMKSKTQKIKPRLIGCVWYDSDKKVDDAIDKFLQPLSIITNNNIIIKKRSDFIVNSKREKKGLDVELIPDLIRLVHGNGRKGTAIVKEFLEFLKSKNVTVTASQVKTNLKQIAEWAKVPNEKNKMCWIVKEDVRMKHNVELQLPNKWEHVTI
ncbi:PREDICTED: chromatin assembly factor 1 subunit A isoform X3 [Nicrophorus vespilloides]|nr:PREDICTED: chromatin assembly factor 1 subunit A isoform X3 [Nicrophorus vespilloides]